MIEAPQHAQINDGLPQARVMSAAELMNLPRERQLMIPSSLAELQLHLRETVGANLPSAIVHRWGYVNLDWHTIQPTDVEEGTRMPEFYFGTPKNSEISGPEESLAAVLLNYHKNGDMGVILQGIYATGIAHDSSGKDRIHSAIFNPQAPFNAHSVGLSIAEDESQYHRLRLRTKPLLFARGNPVSIGYVSKAMENHVSGEPSQTRMLIAEDPRRIGDKELTIHLGIIDPNAYRTTQDETTNWIEHESGWFTEFPRRLFANVSTHSSPPSPARGWWDRRIRGQRQPEAPSQSS